jgi:hypothetical protein
VLLPDGFAALTFTDLFTGARHRPVTSETASWLFVGQVLDQLPVTLLVSSQYRSGFNPVADADL